jgi:hypothetical protein
MDTILILGILGIIVVFVILFKIFPSEMIESLVDIICDIFID